MKGRLRELQPLQIVIILLCAALGINLICTVIAYYNVIRYNPWEYETRDYLYRLEVQNYTSLAQCTRDFDFTKFEDDTLAMECYYIGKYYEVSMFYHAYEEGSIQKEEYGERLEEYASHVITFAYAIEEIDALFE